MCHGRFLGKNGSAPKPFPISIKFSRFSPSGTSIAALKFGDDRSNIG